MQGPFLDRQVVLPAKRLEVYSKNILKCSVSKMEKNKLCKSTRFKRFDKNRERFTCLLLMCIFELNIM